ncbi:MAG: hypothetical protein DMD53_07555 [Gemmatimonadetes bacterium]|nr:MAG: hypothetical protein DMD53_07555 [Gemmatimonadota bacterium]
MGPRARRRELQRAPRCVVRGGSRLPRRRRARREPADGEHRPHLRPDRADPAAALVGRGTAARRRQSSIELGLALRRLPELPSSLTAARTRDRAALPPLHRGVRDRLGRPLLGPRSPWPHREQRRQPHPERDGCFFPPRELTVLRNPSWNGPSPNCLLRTRANRVPAGCRLRADPAMSPRFVTPLRCRRHTTDDRLRNRPGNAKTLRNSTAKERLMGTRFWTTTLLCALGWSGTAWTQTFNPKAYGAKGDGVADDAPAINAALAAVPAAGGVLELSPGVYRITAPLRLSKKVIVAGAGFTEDPAVTSRAAVVLVKDGTFDGISVEADACILRDFQLDGTAGNGGAGIVVKAARVVLENVAVMNQGGVGVRIGSPHTNANLWRIFNLVVVKNGSHGLYIHDPDPRIPDVNAGVLVGLDTRRNGGDGLRIDNATDNIFHGVMAADNAGYGINLHGTPGDKATGHIFWFPYAESNQRGDILLDTNAVFNVVFGFNALTKVDGTIDRGRENLVLGHDRAKVGGRLFRSPVAFTAARISHPAISGYWDLTQDSTNRRLLVTLNGSDADPVIARFQHGGRGRVELQADGALLETHVALAYNFTVRADASRGNYFTLLVTDADGFTIANPLNLVPGQRITYDIKNGAGRNMGTITWGHLFLLAGGSFTNPANGKRRLITFRYDGANLVEESRSQGDT